MALILAASLLAAPAAFPEQSTAEFPTLAERTFKIKHKKVDDVYLLVSGLLSDAGVITVVPKENLISIKDRPDRVKQVIRLIANFDSPPDKVSFDIRLVKGFREPKAKAPSKALLSGFPGDLPKVVNYQRFEMLERYSVDGLEGRRISTGEEETSAYRLDMHIGHVDKERGIIVLEKFLLRQKVPNIEGSGARGVKLEFSDILMNNRPRVFGSAKSAKSPKALFVIIQGRIL